MKRILSIIGVAVALTACGGGGDDAPATSTPAPPPAATTAEGFWSGTASTGTAVALAVLENGETWGVYSSGGFIVGALYGQTTSTGSALSGAGNDFNIPSGTVSAGSYTGTFAAKSSVSVNTSAGGSFKGTYNTGYDATPSLATLAGAYTGTGVSGNSPVQNVSVNIAPTGAFTVPASLGCSATGIASTRPSGKNIFNVNVTFTGTNCALGNGATASGIAYYDTVARQLLVMALNRAKTDGFIYLGSKLPS
jgi:hypothetical protein